MFNCGSQYMVPPPTYILGSNGSYRENLFSYFNQGTLGGGCCGGGFGGGIFPWMGGGCMGGGMFGFPYGGFNNGNSGYNINGNFFAPGLGDKISRGDFYKQTAGDALVLNSLPNLMSGNNVMGSILGIALGVGGAGAGYNFGKKLGVGNTGSMLLSALGAGLGNNIGQNMGGGNKSNKTNNSNYSQTTTSYTDYSNGIDANGKARSAKTSTATNPNSTTTASSLSTNNNGSNDAYTVVKDDNLCTIVRKYNNLSEGQEYLTALDVAKKNKIENPDLILPGQKIKHVPNFKAEG